MVTYKQKRTKYNERWGYFASKNRACPSVKDWMTEFRFFQRYMLIVNKIQCENLCYVIQISLTKFSEIDNLWYENRTMILEYPTNYRVYKGVGRMTRRFLKLTCREQTFCCRLHDLVSPWALTIIYRGSKLLFLSHIYGAHRTNRSGLEFRKGIRKIKKNVLSNLMQETRSLWGRAAGVKDKGGSEWGTEDRF